jgi:hypothetical protein
MSFIVTENTDMLDALKDPDVQDLAKKVSALLVGKTHDKAMAAVYNVMQGLRCEHYHHRTMLKVTGCALDERIAKFRALES